MSKVKQVTILLAYYFIYVSWKFQENGRVHTWICHFSKECLAINPKTFWQQKQLHILGGLHIICWIWPAKLANHSVHSVWEIVLHVIGLFDVLVAYFSHFFPCFFTWLIPAHKSKLQTCLQLRCLAKEHNHNGKTPFCTSPYTVI